MNLEKCLDYLRDIRVKFNLEPDEFSPISTWFSYGSNLFRQDFERKMSDHGSNLSLVRARPGRLLGWMRRLDNESRTRGLAYSISKGVKRSFVNGIVHDVPIGDLAPFLQFEGILNKNYELKDDEGKNKRRYEIKKVTVQLVNSNEKTECFTLVGRCTVFAESKKRELVETHADKLMDYVRTAIKGAIDFDINIAPFQRDLKWIKSKVHSE